jgi:hypothetical protein
MATPQKCNDCGKEVSKRAKLCPHCGAPVKHEFGCLGVIALLFLIFIVVGVISTSVDQKTGGSPTTLPTKPSLYGQVQIGMTKEVVTNRMGRPAAEYQIGDKEFLVYGRNGKIEVENGKVVAISGDFVQPSVSESVSTYPGYGPEQYGKAIWLCASRDQPV